MIADFFEFLLNGVFDFLNGVLGILPHMPFDASQIQSWLHLSEVSTVMGWINYFLPLDVASSIVALWATALMAYVGVKLALKYTGEIV